MTGIVPRNYQREAAARANLKGLEHDPLETLRREMDLWPSEDPEVRAPMSDGERAVFEMVWREDSTMDEESDDVDAG